MQQNNGTWTGRCFFFVFPVALAIAILQKRKKSNACYAGLLTGRKPVQKEGLGRNAGFSSTKIGRRKRVKGAMPSYLF